jgi:hypothetical protein
LRRSTADARGFGDAVNLPVLAKLMLAERFIPRLFDQIASAAAAEPNGRCHTLAEIEEPKDGRTQPSTASSEMPGSVDKTDGKPRRPATIETRQTTESAVLVEWQSSPEIVAWAQVAPALAGVDLRPYLFVAKDRKDYLGPASVLGHLAAVVEQLLGPKMQVQAWTARLKKLAPTEAAQVFEGVSARIFGGGSFATEPPGAAGLVVLVKAHPELESSLVDLLERLPVAQLGPWAVGGWSDAITSEGAKTRLSALLGKWAQTSENAMLKAAAEKTAKIPQRPR